MHPDLVALLALQEKDAVITELERSAAELDERDRALDAERVEGERALERLRERIGAEEHRHRELFNKIDEHKSLQNRHLAALDAVRRPREATAAMSQIEMMRRVVVQEESELQAIDGTLAELRAAVAEQDRALGELAVSQASARAEIAEARAALEAQLAEARENREARAAHVSRPALVRYERIRGRARSDALYPLHGMTCGRCHTAVPLQRRNVIASGRSVEICEGCGVMLYAAS